MSGAPGVNPCFEFFSSWRPAAELLEFEPLVPAARSFGEPRQLAVFVQDHRQRRLAPGDRSLEAYYDNFVFSQARRGEREARRQALEVKYGAAPQGCEVGGCEARAYQLGPEPEAGDIDPRSPAVVAWCDGAMFYLLASDTMEVEKLMPLAAAIGARGGASPPVRSDRG